MGCRAVCAASARVLRDRVSRAAALGAGMLGGLSSRDWARPLFTMRDAVDYVRGPHDDI